MKPKPLPYDPQALVGIAKKLGLDKPLSPDSPIGRFAKRYRDRIAFKEERERLEYEEQWRQRRRRPPTFDIDIIDEVREQLRNHAEGYRFKRNATTRAIQILQRRGPIRVGNRQITIGETQRRTIEDEIVSPVWQELPRPVRRRRR